MRINIGHTNNNQIKINLVLKSYKTLAGKNLTEIALKDLQLSQLGLRSQVYQYYDFGRIQDFIQNKIDFLDENGISIGKSHSIIKYIEHRLVQLC